MGKKKLLNNCFTGIFFLVLGIIFLVLTFAVPIAMVADPVGDPCTKANPSSLRPGEQMYCKPEDLKEKWTGEYHGVDGTSVNDYVNIYKISGPLPETVTRTSRVIHSSTSLSRNKFIYFNFSVSAASSLDLQIDCTSSQSTLRTYLLTSEQFEEASERDSDGSITFYYSKVSAKILDTCATDNAVQTYQLAAPNYYYLIFLYVASSISTVSFRYDITPHYTVYKLDAYSDKKCSTNECTYKKMSDNEYVFIDFPYSTTAPAVVHARIHNEDPDITAALVAGLVLGVITIVLLIIAAVFLFKWLKKMGKIGKKAVKKAEKKEAEMAAANATPAAQPYPDQAYAQPYPGQM